MQKIIFALLALTLILLTSAASETTITINNTPDPNPIKPPESISTNYLVAVGQYEVGFNIASPGFFEKGYRTTYNSDNLHREDYNSYSTSIADDNYESIIFIEVREFKYPVSKNAQNLESDTINGYAQFVPHTPRIMDGNGLNVVDYGSPPGYHGYHGIIIDWPSDKTEIIMQGYLTSREIWRDICGSINLSEKPKSRSISLF